MLAPKASRTIGGSLCRLELRDPAVRWWRQRAAMRRVQEELHRWVASALIGCEPRLTLINGHAVCGRPRPDMASMVLDYRETGFSGDSPM